MTTERRYFTLNDKLRAAPGAAAPRRGKGLRITLMLLSILLVLLLLAWLIFPHVMNPDRLVRFFRYMGLREKENYGRVTFEAAAGNVYAGFDDGLLVGTETGLTLYALDGEQKAFVQGSLPTPVLRTGGEVSLVFSPGSSYAAAIGAGGDILLDGALSGALLDASVSFDGYSVRLTAESGSKAVAEVLNPKQEAIYRFSSRTRYLNACAVSEKGEWLAVASLEEERSIYRSAVVLLRTDRPVADLEQEDSGAVRAELGNRVIYELRFLDESHLLAVTQDELVFLNLEGELLSSLPLEGERLVDYAVSREGWLLLALEGGGAARVLSLDASGNILARLDLADRVRSVSAEGRYGAVLTEMELRILDSRLEEYDRSWDVLGATRVVVRADGTALLIAAGGTKLFIP